MARNILLRLAIVVSVSMLCIDNSMSDDLEEVAKECFVDMGFFECLERTVTCAPIANGVCDGEHVQGSKNSGNLLEWYPTTNFEADGSTFELICDRITPCIAIEDEQGNITGCGPDLHNVRPGEKRTVGYVNYDEECL